MRSIVGRAMIVLLALAGCAGDAGHSAAKGARQPDEGAEVVTITEGGSAQHVLLIAPSSKPKAVVIMFSGGDGTIGIGRDGAIKYGGNFLIRTRSLWVASGFLFVAVDALQGEDRIGPAGEQAIAAVVRVVKQHTDAPIWLVGTSAGAPSALAGAASLPPGMVHGVVISSPVSKPGNRSTVFDVRLDRVTMPVLIQFHQADTCGATPPSDVPSIKAALSAARTVEIVAFQGGDAPRSTPCQPFSPHGFFGIEQQVVTATADWIVGH